MIWMMLIVAAWCAVLLLACWGTRRAKKADEPVPYWPAEAAIEALSSSVKCSWCTPKPRGLCSCAARCGHVRCVHVPGRGWTARDRKILEGKKLP